MPSSKEKCFWLKARVAHAQSQLFRPAPFGLVFSDSVESGASEGGSMFGIKRCGRYFNINIINLTPLASFCRFIYCAWIGAFLFWLD
jgi:hypothetical protein